MANHGPSYGLSRELEKKNLARFSLEEAQEVLQWIEQVTGRQFPKDATEFDSSVEVSEAIKDGETLCILMNRIVGSPMKIGPVRYHMSPKMPFHKMENISNFLDACKSYGVPEISCFQTVDLYENKQPYKVIECLRSLAAVAQARHAPIPFPAWVLKMSIAPVTSAAKHAQNRYSSDTNGTNGVRNHAPNASDAIIPLQYGTNKCASQKGMTPYGLPRQIKPDSFNSQGTAAANENGGVAKNSTSYYVSSSSSSNPFD